MLGPVVVSHADLLGKLLPVVEYVAILVVRVVHFVAHCVRAQTVLLGHNSWASVGIPLTGWIAVPRAGSKWSAGQRLGSHFPMV